MTICDTCKGQLYPRQCRHAAAWRRAQGAPTVCPHGLALNELPIGDNAPRPARRPAAPTAPFPCAHGERVCGGCKARIKVRCSRELPAVVVPIQTCHACRPALFPELVR